MRCRDFYDNILVWFRLFRRDIDENLDDRIEGFLVVNDLKQVEEASHKGFIRYWLETWYRKDIHQQ